MNCHNINEYNWHIITCLCKLVQHNCCNKYRGEKYIHSLILLDSMTDNKSVTVLGLWRYAHKHLLQL